MLITMLTSGVAVVLSSAGFLVYDLISFRHSLSQDLVTQADIIGYNSAAAMAFKDESAATVTLSALQAKEDIVLGGAVYTRWKNLRPIFSPDLAAAKSYAASASQGLPF